MMAHSGADGLQNSKIFNRANFIKNSQKSGFAGIFISGITVAKGGRDDNHFERAI